MRSNYPLMPSDSQAAPLFFNRESERVMEIWKDITGYVGFYRVSNLGRVKSLKRITPHGHTRKERILKQADNFGYKKVVLSKNANTKDFFVHCLVMDSFVGEKPLGKVVDHINSNQGDNRLENLQYITQRENIAKSNQHIGSSSKHVGVGRNGSKWRSRIHYNQKLIHIGCYDSEDEAVEARVNKEVELGLR